MKELDLNEFDYKRIDYLFERKSIVYSLALTGACFLTWSYRTPNNSFWIVSWLSFYFIITVIRFLIISIYRDRKETFSPKAWEVTYSSLSSIIGLLWASSALFMITQEQNEVNLTSVFLICGIASASLVGNASSRMSTLAMLTTILIPSAVLYYFSSFENSNSLSGLLIFYYFGLIATSFKLNKFIKKNIELNFVNTKLINSLRESSQKLDDTEKQALNSSKLAAIGEMASGIAHEINNPLTILNGNLRNIDRYIGKPNSEEKVSEMIQKCHNSIKRISKIIRGLKKISRDGTNDDFEEVSVKSIYDDIESLTHERFKVGGIKFDMHNNCPDEMIYCQPIQISQILLNLLNNAYHAVEDHTHKWVKISADIFNGEISLRVLDSGVGIEEAAAEKIFTPFFTTKEIGKGTGLGLSISREIAINHEGKLFIDHEHENTCFTLSLPSTKRLAA